MGPQVRSTGRKRDLGVIPAVVAKLNVVKKNGKCEPELRQRRIVPFPFTLSVEN